MTVFHELLIPWLLQKDSTSLSQRQPKSYLKPNQIPETVVHLRVEPLEVEAVARRSLDPRVKLDTARAEALFERRHTARRREGKIGERSMAIIDRYWSKRTVSVKGRYKD